MSQLAPDLFSLNYADLVDEISNFFGQETKKIIESNIDFIKAVKDEDEEEKLK